MKNFKLKLPKQNTEPRLTILTVDERNGRADFISVAALEAINDFLNENDGK